MTATVAVASERPDGARLRRALAVVATLALAAAIVAVFRAAVTPAGREHLLLEASDFEFSTRSLRAEAGEVELSFANTDAVPHTFTVEDLGVHLEVGGGEARRISFDAEPGRYRFVCTVPGHDTPGMRGVLVVAD